MVLLLIFQYGHTPPNGFVGISILNAIHESVIECLGKIIYLV